MTKNTSTPKEAYDAAIPAKGHQHLSVQQSLEGVGFERGTSDDYYTPP